MNAMDLSSALSMKFTLSTPNPALLCSSMPNLAFVPRFFQYICKTGAEFVVGRDWMLPRTRRKNRFECNQDLCQQAIQDMNSKKKGFRKCTMTNVSIGCTSRL